MTRCTFSQSARKQTYISIHLRGVLDPRPYMHFKLSCVGVLDPRPHIHVKLSCVGVLVPRPHIHLKRSWVGVLDSRPHAYFKLFRVGLLDPRPHAHFMHYLALPIRHHNHLFVSIQSVLLFHYPFCSSNSKILYHKSCHSGL